MSRRLTINPHSRRGFGSVVAVLLLAIASIVIVGIATPGADRHVQNMYGVDSIRAALAAEAGVSVASAALVLAEDIVMPPTLAGAYDIAFVESEPMPDTYEIEITSRSGAAVRIVRVTLELD